MSSKRPQKSSAEAIPGIERIELNVSQFEQSEIIGYANRCRITELDDIVGFDFFEERESGHKVSVFRVRMGIDDVLTRLWQSAKEFTTEIRKRYPDPISQDYLSAQPPADDSVLSVAVNFISIIRQGLDATFEFYYITPRSLLAQRANKKPSEKLDARTLGTVQMPIYLTIAILSEIESRIPRYRERMRYLPDLRAAAEAAERDGLFE